MISASTKGTRHLFQGQLWTQETGLNDYRNRVELPSMGVFLQPDPIGFKGDAANLYRFCTNNAVNKSDPMGLHSVMATLWNRLAWRESGSFLSAEQFDSLRQGQARIVLEIIPAGDRHISQKEVRRKDGIRALGLTEPDFKVRDPEEQPDGSWKVTGVYTLNVKYADAPGTKAGPKSLRRPRWKSN